MRAKVLIGGILDRQIQQIEKENIPLDLTFVTANEPLSRWNRMLKQSDVTLVNVGFVRHFHSAAPVKQDTPYIHYRGGISKLKQLLDVIVEADTIHEAYMVGKELTK